MAHASGGDAAEDGALDARECVGGHRQQRIGRAPDVAADRLCRIAMEHVPLSVQAILFFDLRCFAMNIRRLADIVFPMVR